MRTLLAQEAARRAFEGVDENGYRELGWIFDEQVQVVGFAVAGESVAVHLGEHLRCAPANPRQRLGVEDFAPSLATQTKWTVRLETLCSGLVLIAVRCMIVT